MTTTETPTETAFWAAISERPEDGLRRKVFADWLDEQAGTVECGRCAPPRALPPYHWTCPTCSGTGRVSDGRAELAKALRATVDRMPQKKHGYWRWRRDGEGKAATPYRVPVDVWARACSYSLINRHARRWARYMSAVHAIRDLCRAWLAVHGGA